MNNPPGYYVQWLATKTGRWSHAVIHDIDEPVLAAVLEDPNGGPYTIDHLDRQLSYCQDRNRLARAEKLTDKRCESCLRNVAELNHGIARARRDWARSHLDSIIELLATLAPIGDPEHVTPE